jgi:hypothetical protein
VRTTYVEQELPHELVNRLALEFRPLPVRELVMRYLITHPWNEKKIVLMITAAWQRYKVEGGSHG